MRLNGLDTFLKDAIYAGIVIQSKTGSTNINLVEIETPVQDLPIYEANIDRTLSECTILVQVQTNVFKEIAAFVTDVSRLDAVSASFDAWTQLVDKYEHIIVHSNVDYGFPEDTQF